MISAAGRVVDPLLSDLFLSVLTLVLEPFSAKCPSLLLYSRVYYASNQSFVHVNFEEISPFLLLILAFFFGAYVLEETIYVTLHSAISLSD